MIDSLNTIKKKMIMFNKLDKAVVNLMSKESSFNIDPETGNIISENNSILGNKMIRLFGRSLELEERISKLERG